ncbi:transmembrane protein 132C isoform X1 [Brienomyrus brachyistius]|uniref:transmembrane protein 132C isoform X1 n=2 Tax=Brienomyrus brachyistius TaxID=42636 RepID=UPI0020B442E2|nr:transmembrane protein 132C isoform X1 [Brienomyrus brachyistius]
MSKMRKLRIDKASALQVCPILKMLILASFWRGMECRGSSDGQQKFSALPIYLPVTYQVQNAESFFFLKEAGQEVMRNGSLQSRAEPFFVHLTDGGIPSVNCSYGNLTAEASVPLELLQATPPLLPGPRLVTANWKVQAHLVTPRVTVKWPRVQVLFYLAGRRWDEEPVPPELLPCVRVAALLEAGETAGSCRLEGSLGICVVELELPSGWFSVPLGRKKGTGAGVGATELFYTIQPLEGSNKNCGAKESPRARNNGPRKGGAMLYSHRIGSVELVSNPEEAPQLNSLILDDNVEIQAPARPVKQGQTVTFQVNRRSGSMVEQFILRVMFSEGVSFVGLRLSEQADWEAEKEALPAGAGLSIFCYRKPGSTGDRAKRSAYEVMRVEFEIDNFINVQSTQPVRWHIEYPGSTAAEAEGVSNLYVSQRALQGIVPLAEDTEILNTAILTGRRVAVPVKVVTVEEDGTVRELDEPIGCSSTNEDVIKVSPTCDAVLVNGKEISGKQSVQVNFTFLHLSAQLGLTVWAPRLPLQIEVSDAELSQVKGWRVPILASRRPTRDSEDDEDEEKKGKGCTLQYQYALVRVLTHFVAEPAETGGQLAYLLGPDWQADITELVVDYFKVEDPRIARLVDGRVLMGRDLGITTIQVLSPLSDSILAEKTITVLDDKVTITDLGVQLVAGLSLSLQPSLANSHTIVATTTALDLLHSIKQDAVISAWIQFSDGSVTPLSIYDSKDFTLTATSLDENIVSTYQEHPLKWPVVVAEGEGQGPLIRVEMVISETCQKSKRKSVLAVGTGNVRVKFGQNDVDLRGTEEEDNDNLDNGTSDRRQKTSELDKASPDSWKYNSASSDREEGAMRKVSTTTKTTITSHAGGSKLAGGTGGQGVIIPVDLTSFPAQVDLPGGSNLPHASRGLSDLEIGMYALLGVFCLAILVFLINCVTFAFKYRHKQLPVLEQGNMNHAHDWVWLGNEAELLEHHRDTSPQPDECTTIIDRGDGYEESKYLLNGGIQKNIQGQIHRPADQGPCNGKDPKSELLNNSPSAKRKRVKFTSFATILPDDGGPYTNSILIGNEDDIKWVCQDMDLGQSAEIRTYMERLQDNL